MRLSKKDKEILNYLQKDFPVCSRPYSKLSDHISGLTEKDIFQRVKRLKKQGVIRRMGASFDSKKMGFRTTLAAMKVSPDRLDEIGRIVSSLKQVTHNYSRDGEYNLWFTLTASSISELKQIIAGLKVKTGIKDILNLPAKKIFKLDVRFGL